MVVVVEIIPVVVFLPQVRMEDQGAGVHRAIRVVLIKFPVKVSIPEVVMLAQHDKGTTVVLVNRVIRTTPVAVAVLERQVKVLHEHITQAVLD